MDNTKRYRIYFREGEAWFAPLTERAKSVYYDVVSILSDGINRKKHLAYWRGELQDRS